MSDNKTPSLTFWDHLDQLRGVLVKVIVVTVAFAIVAFIFKEQLFRIVLAPKEADFITYRILNRISHGAISRFSVSLINTGLAEQFIIHMKTALCAGVLCAHPPIFSIRYSGLSLRPSIKTKNYMPAELQVADTSCLSQAYS